MFRITRDPSSGSFIQCLAKIRIIVLLCPLTWTWSVLWRNICPWCVCVPHCLDRHSRVVIYHHIICLLTPWCRVLLEKLAGFQLVKKFPAFYGTRRFITAFTSARHLSLSWASSIQSICCHNTDHVHVNGHDRTILVILAKYCTRLRDDGSSVIRNMLEHF